MTSRERALLRGAANTFDPVCIIGKEGFTPTVRDSIRCALEARELIKVSVSENSPVSAREACTAACAALEAQPVQVIGRRFVIYKRNRKTDKYGI